MDAAVQVVLVILAWVVLGDARRIWTDLFLAFCVVWAYEAASTRFLGGTPAMRLLSLRVVEIDQVDKPSGGASLRRGAAVAALTTIPVIGWAIWALTTLTDSLGRGIPDRLSLTIVVPDDFNGSVAFRDLAGYADGVQPPKLTHLGRVADLDVRMHARLRRLTDEPVLAAAIGLLALSVSLPFTTGTAILASAAAWIVVFVISETRMVHRRGDTPGHRMAGLVIVDRRTGVPPTTWRSLLRALVLGLTLYVPLLWPILFVSMLMMRFTRFGRGLHDLAGGTIVISDPRLHPEIQRQRSMRMKLGLAG